MRYPAAVVIAAALPLLRAPLEQLDPSAPPLVSLAATIAVSWYFGLGPGIIAAIAAAAAAGVARLPTGGFELDLLRGGLHLAVCGGMAGLTRLAASRAHAAPHADDEPRRPDAAAKRAGDAVITFDEHGTIASANPAVSRIFGYEADELVGRNISQLLPVPDPTGDRPHPTTNVQPEAGQTGGTKHELAGRRKDGTTFPAELVVGGSHQAGKPVFRGIVRDMREGLEGDPARRFLAAIVESTHDAIIGKMPDGTIMSWNRAAERIYGYTAEEAVGRNISMLVPPEIPNDVPGIHERVLSGQKIENYQTLRMRKDGTRLHVSLTVSPIHDLDGRVIGLSTIARDITEQVEMQQALEENAQEVEELNAALEQTIEELRKQQEKTARARDAAQAASRAKSQFLATMSHELRTPLTGIVGYADLLESEVFGPLNDRQKDKLVRIKAGAWHLKAVIDEILTFARVEAGREEVRSGMVDVVALAREALALVEPQARSKGLGLHATLPETPVRVITDAGKLRQIFLNLLGNAVKFTDRGSVSLDLALDDAWLEFRVSDTGPGIPPHELDRIFEPFTQVDQEMTRTKGGTGLGLAVTQRLIQLLGGEVRVQSEVGRGSTFTGRIPASSLDPDAMSPTP